VDDEMMMLQMSSIFVMLPRGCTALQKMAEEMFKSGPDGKPWNVDGKYNGAPWNPAWEDAFEAQRVCFKHVADGQYRLQICDKRLWDVKLKEYGQFR